MKIIFEYDVDEFNESDSEEDNCCIDKIKEHIYDGIEKCFSRIEMLEEKNKQLESKIDAIVLLFVSNSGRECSEKGT